MKLKQGNGDKKLLRVRVKKIQNRKHYIDQMSHHKLVTQARRHWLNWIHMDVDHIILFT